MSVSFRLELHVHHHFDEPLTVYTAPSLVAQNARIKLGVDEDMATITVDETGEVARVEFTDQKDNLTSAPVGAVATFTSSDTSVLTVDNSIDNMLAKLIPQDDGTADISVTLAGADGSPLKRGDGSEFAAIDPVTVTVTPGEAVGARLSVEDTTPEPGPEPGPTPEPPAPEPTP